MGNSQPHAVHLNLSKNESPDSIISPLTEIGKQTETEFTLLSVRTPLAAPSACATGEAAAMLGLMAETVEGAYRSVWTCVSVSC